MLARSLMLYQPGLAGREGSLEMDIQSELSMMNRISLTQNEEKGHFGQNTAMSNY